MDRYTGLVRERITELVGSVDQREINRSMALYFLGARDAYQLAQDLSVEERAEAHNQYAALYRRVTQEKR